MDEIPSELWIKRVVPRPGAKLRLLCLPYAAAGASVYREWCAKLPDWIEVVCVQLPGRELRIREHALRSTKEIARTLVPLLLERLQPPFALFGHSMGAAIAFELGLQLEATQRDSLVHVIASGRGAPHVRVPSMLHTLPDVELLRALRRYGETPYAILNDRDLMAVMLPKIRADFEVNETYLCTPGARLRCPLTVFAGSEDHFVPREHVLGWADHSADRCEVRWFPGGHFFVRERRSQILSTIVELLGAHDPAPPVQQRAAV